MYRLYLTTQTLAALGQFCPLLERCDLMGGFNMLQLRLYQTPLFPRLHSLCIRDFTSLVIDRTGMKAPTKLGFESPEDHVKQLEEHFPKLQDLTLTYANDTRFSRLDEHEFSNSVLYKWRARQEERERCFLENYS
ncbi:hypothetical protein BDV36DRAFT_255032 [Aspergillus pseudocaelatus]|nr:hypothetical protein BDV36DRAFT_255032 [Aspergillus pseudocaelatus]